jgi:hypothetical protein
MNILPSDYLDLKMKIVREQGKLNGITRVLVAEKLN